MASPKKEIQEQSSAEQPAEGQQRVHRPWWRRLIRWILGIVGGIVVLLLLLTALLYVPPIQDWVIKTTAQAVEKSTGYELGIGEIRVGFPLRLSISNVRAKDRNTGELIASLEQLTAKVGIMPLLKSGSIPVSGFKLRGVDLALSLAGDSVSVSGTLQEVDVDMVDFDIYSTLLAIDNFRIKEADILVQVITDTIPKEREPQTPSPLVITFNKADLEDVASKVVVFSKDSILIDTYVERGELIGGEVDLPNGYYHAKSVDLDALLSSLGFEMDALPMPWIARVKGREMYYGGSHKVGGDIIDLYFEVGDGWSVEQGRLLATKDSARFDVQGIELQLPRSRISGDVILPFDEWIPAAEGKADVALRGRVDLSEFARFLGGVEGAPEDPFQLSLTARGDMDQTLRAELQLRNDQVLDFGVTAQATGVLQEKRGPITAQYDLQVEEQATAMVARLANAGREANPSWRLPAGMSLTGKAEMRGSQLGTDFVLNTTQGGVLGYLLYNLDQVGYKGQLRLDQLYVGQFLPKDSIGVINAILQLEGIGSDPFDPQMQAHIFANVDSVQYGGATFNQITFLSELKDSHLFGALDSADDAMKLTAQIDAMLHRNDISGSVNLFVDTIIPSRVGLDFPTVQGARLELRSTVRSDLDQFYDFDGEVENFWIQTDKNLIHPTNTYVIASTSEASMYGEVTSGDLSLKVDVENGLKDFTHRITSLTEVITTSLADSIQKIDMRPWLEHYPTMDVQLTMGRNNLLRAYLDEMRIGARSSHLNLRTTTSEGLTGEGVISYFQMDTFRIDNIDLILRQDSSFFYAFSSIHKDQFRNQLPFTIMSSLTTNVHRSELYLHWLDHKEEDFLQMGLELWNQPNGDLTLDFTPDPIVLFHNEFTSVGDGGVTFPQGKREEVKADLELRSRKGATISLRDVPDERGHLLRAVLNEVELSQLEGVRIIPRLKGVVDAEATWLQIKDAGGQEYVAQVSVDDFYYEDKPLGTMGVQASATQGRNKTTYLEADADVEGDPVAHLISFQPVEGQSRLWVRANDLPLTKANPFLPRRYAEATGLVSAELANYDTRRDIQTATTAEYEGVVRFKDAEVYVASANETYGLDEKPILVREGRLRLENFALTSNNSKLYADGELRLDQAEYPIDLQLTGRDLVLLNSAETADTELYGTLQADADLHILGPLRAFQMTGNVSVKGNTDLTYKSQKSELKKRNNYAGLVEFTDFSDTLFVAKKSAVDSLSLSGLDIRLNIHIDPATRVNVILSPDEQNKVSLQGGGDFNLKIPPYGAMNLSGDYSVIEGSVGLKISMPPITRQFNITPGSHVTWSGPLMEPYIDLSATSSMRSQVSLAGEPSRSVEFDVTLHVENRLDDLKLRFTTSAPSDLAVQNALASLSPEEQNRQSLMLLTSGLYMGSRSTATSGFDMNSALASLAASQFNSIAGEALDAEINLGISNTANAYGTGTDYTYSIAKKFYNNRINVTVGGRMMTGQAATGMKQSFIDNMTLEYRLDEAGTRFLKLFHRRNLENLLDGEVIETGGGYLIRRRLNRLRDIFDFRRKPTIKEEQDHETNNAQEIPHETN
ncbi:MAG: translocation/assembly module TamB domain-containing protein [Porphyromonas sp.]|nr:translocation/assembly module TamB domain-containing protein [Porphyromonas sp.]